MTMQYVGSVQETDVRAQAVVALTQLEVQLLADKITDEISTLGKKNISKKRIIEMVARELQKLGILSKEGESLVESCPQSCSPAL